MLYSSLMTLETILMMVHLTHQYKLARYIYSEKQSLVGRKELNFNQTQTLNC